MRPSAHYARKGMQVKYVGESGRSTYERGCKHLTTASSRTQKKHLWTHAETDHPEHLETNETLSQETALNMYKFRVTGTYKGVLRRQLGEAIKIERKQGEEGALILNDKAEYNRCHIPTLMIDEGPNGPKRQDQEQTESGHEKSTNNNFEDIRKRQNRTEDAVITQKSEKRRIQPKKNPSKPEYEKEKKKETQRNNNRKR